MKLYDPKPHDIWHFVIAGNLQDDYELNGCLRCWDFLLPLRSRHVHVELLEWHANMRDVAEKVAAVKLLHDAPCRVTINAYSWGGGWGAPRLARELGKRGIDVLRMNLCDPVYRHPLWCLTWLALVPGRLISIPANVHLVQSFVQKNSLLRGHRVSAEGIHTTIAPPVEVAGVTHVNMHKLEAWHAQAVANAKEVASGEWRVASAAKKGSGFRVQAGE